MSEQERDVEALAEDLWADSASPGASPTDADRDLAQRVLASDWLAERDARTKAEALRGVRQALRDERQRDPSTYNVWSRVGQVVDRIGGDQ